MASKGVNSKNGLELYPLSGFSQMIVIHSLIFQVEQMICALLTIIEQGFLCMRASFGKSMYKMGQIFFPHFVIAWILHTVSGKNKKNWMVGQNSYKPTPDKPIINCNQLT